MRRETFPTTTPLRLELTLPAGEIDLEAAETHETIVELEPLRDNDDSRAAVEDARVELRDRGDGAELVVEVREPRFGFSSEIEVRATVRMPEGTALNISTAAAELRARGRFGDAELKTASGDVDLEEVGVLRARSASGDLHVREVTGEASVQTASGDVHVGRIGGEGEIRCASGDVQVGEAEASLRVQTASGDQEIASVAKGAVELQSASGDIRVGVRRGSRLWIDARSSSGDVGSDLEIADTPTGEEGPLVELRAAAMSGDVEILRAEPPAELSR